MHVLVVIDKCSNFACTCNEMGSHRFFVIMHIITMRGRLTTFLVSFVSSRHFPSSSWETKVSIRMWTHAQHMYLCLLFPPLSPLVSACFLCIWERERGREREMYYYSQMLYDIPSSPSLLLWSSTCFFILCFITMNRITSTSLTLKQQCTCTCIYSSLSPSPSPPPSSLSLV